MSVQIVSDFYNLFPNKLTLVFTIGSIVLVAVGNALFRRYKVNNMQSSKYAYGPTIINHYLFPYFIFDVQYVQRCSKVPGPPTQIPLFGSATEFVLPPERILRYQQPFQMQNFFDNWIFFHFEEIMPHAYELYQKYNKSSIIRIWIGSQPWFLLGGAESAEVNELFLMT